MTSNNHIEYSVVIPVYNSAEFLQELYNRLQSVFKQMNKTFEVIFNNYLEGQFILKPQNPYKNIKYKLDQ